MTAHSSVRRAGLRGLHRARLSGQTLIFTNGPSLTGKTTLARHLGRRLRVPVRATYQYGIVLTDGALDDRKRLGRYGPLFADARLILASGRSVILDGNFGDYARRKPLWRLAGALGARVIAIHTSCDDLELIRARAERRAADPTAPDHGVGVEAFLLTRDEIAAHPLEVDHEFGELGVEVVRFHTGPDGHVTCAPDASADARMVAAILRRSGLLGSLSECLVRGSGLPECVAAMHQCGHEHGGG
jgi:hypothetical protein